MKASERKAKIRWNCRRGMLELDLMLQDFTNKNLENMTDEQLSLFEGLLEKGDPDLYAWLMGYEIPPNQELLSIVAFIRCNDSP